MERFGDFKRGAVWVGLLAVILAGGVRNARADFTFGRPTNLGPTVNSSTYDIGPSISADGLSLYFTSNRDGGSGEYDLWVSTRPTTDAAWGPPVNLGPPVNSQYAEMDPSISSDGLSLYFADPHTGMGFGRRRPGGFAAGDGGNVWVATRATVNNAWSAPVNLGPALNSTQYSQVVHPSISAGGLSLYVHACDKGIGVATRASTAELFGTPELLKFPGSNGPNDWWPNISADGCMLFLSVWTWTPQRFQLWATRRPTTESNFGVLTKLPDAINVPDCWVFCPNISADGRSLYFTSNQAGGYGSYDLWQAPIRPIVDFNGDEIVDIQDLLRLIESWGRHDPSVDIGPMPWGDGKIDAADLEVLMSYWQQEILPPELVAYWKLDETEGNVAQNSVSENHGILHGEPLWQPSGGKKAGALQFDGIDDYVSTAFVLDPADGLFSVFAWIRGGVPGQVIISQTNGSNGTGETWLGADTMEGKLMTGLQSPGQRGPNPPMISNAVITDGQWHHVGLVVWENKARELYADGMKVAFDTQPVKVSSSDGGLYFGADKALGASTFFSGLIDDVRIYNRALDAAEVAELSR